MVADGKETREFDGRQFVLELALRGNFPSSKRERRPLGQPHLPQDRAQLQSMMATAADYVIAEVEELVDSPARPNHVHTPGIFIDAISRARSTKSASSAAR